MTKSLFAKAKTITAPAAPKKKSDKVEHVIPGLQQLAELDALTKAIGALQKTLSATVKQQMGDKFEELRADGTRPESFLGVDGIATASCEMRKRGTNSALNPDEVKFLEDNGFNVEKQVAVVQMFGINPKYAADDKMLEKISTVLEKAGVPDDLIVVQEEKSKFVVTDATVEAAFKNKAPRAVIEMITTLAVKPKLATTDIAAIIEDIKLQLEEAADASADSAAA